MTRGAIMSQVVETLGQVAIVGGAIVAVSAVGSLGIRIMRGSRQLADLHDLANLHLRPRAERVLTNPADQREGMLDRQTRMETDMADVKSTVDSELHPNGSNSMHDRVRIVEGYVHELRGREARGSRHVREPRPAPVKVDPLIGPDLPHH